MRGDECSVTFSVSNTAFVGRPPRYYLPCASRSLRGNRLSDLPTIDLGAVRKPVQGHQRVNLVGA
jgi:hypothetical protein